MLECTPMNLGPVLHGFAYSLEYLREQVADVPPADMAALPPGITNHPAWIIGHLTATFESLASVIGVTTWLPADWAARYGSGSVPVADAAAYEAKEKALAMLADAQMRVASAVRRLDEAKLDEPFPDTAYLEVFPTIRQVLVQVMVGHTAFHIGQISVWRKAMGLPAMQRSFE